MNQMEKIGKMVVLLKESVTKEYPKRKWTTTITLWDDGDFQVILESFFFSDYAHFIKYHYSKGKTYTGLLKKLEAETIKVLEEAEIHGSNKIKFKKWLKGGI